MRKSCFTESQIIAVIKAFDVGQTTKVAIRDSIDNRPEFISLAPEE